MGIDEVITLEDGKEYVLLLTSNLEGSKYFLAAEVINNEPSENYEIFKELIVNNEFSVEQVLDKELTEKLMEDFEEQFDKMEDNNQE